MNTARFNFRLNLVALINCCIFSGCGQLYAAISTHMTSKTYLPTKTHYETLDGLRGVAAIIVVIFHVLEAFAGGDRFKLIINHGYLAVDFFFFLSGFVVAYAYDDRWGKMTIGEFFKRRLVRLQPMVIMGSLIGAAFFYTQGGTLFPIIDQTPVWRMLLIMLIGCTLIPVTVGMDIRGWQEMHPLNGPAWSLFFEYIANILYALVLRHCNKAVLWVLTLAAAGLSINYLLTGPQGDVIGGWTLDEIQLPIGFTRLLFPFLAGMLLSRSGKVIRVKNGFLWCSLLLTILLCMPRVGNAQQLWMNGLYELFCIMIAFPLIIAMGAGSDMHDGRQLQLNRFLGNISYPLYITHYPLIYLYTAWVVDNKIPLEKGWAMGVALLVAAILIAYACLKWFDEPVRKWLTKRYLQRADRTV